MSEPALTVGRVELPEVITVAEQAKAAGRNDPRPPGKDDIDDFRAQVFAFINAQPAQNDVSSLAMAKTKADEMIFWLRRHRERTHA